MRRMLALTAVVAGLLYFAAMNGCETTLETGFQPQIVVQGFLYANEQADSIVVRQTIPLTATTDHDRVSGAIVTVSSSNTVIPYHESTISAGTYLPETPFVAKPGETYSLRVEALGEVATATTTVPDAIHLDSVKYRGRMLSTTKADTIAYPLTVDSLASEGIQQWWSASPNSAGYGLEAISLDPRDTIILENGPDLPDSLSIGRYRFFILSTTEQVSWLQFRYFGLNAIRALALDKNYQDYILGLYISGSQFNNNTLHVTGGLGIFGSAARTRKLVYLK